MRRTGDVVARAITISETIIPGIVNDVPGPATTMHLSSRSLGAAMFSRSDRRDTIPSQFLDHDKTDEAKHKAQDTTLSATRLENVLHIRPRNFRDSHEIITRPTFDFNDVDSIRIGVRNESPVLNVVASR
jgi:hypothetical protein